MSTFTQHFGPYSFTVWGAGTAALLRKGDRVVHWQGDEAADITDFVSEHGADAFQRLWDDFEDLSTSEPEA